MTKFSERKKKWGEEMVFKSINLPANIVSKLQLLKTLYEDDFGRQVSYGEIIERLLSPMGLGSVDPGIYRDFKKALDARAEFDEVVTRHTKELVDTLAARAEANGTTLLEEAGKEQQMVIEKSNELMKLQDKCQKILEAATLPTPEPGWVEDTWFVNLETGVFYPVYAGKYGLGDFARNVDGERHVSAAKMEARGFMRHYFNKEK